MNPQEFDALLEQAAKEKAGEFHPEFLFAQLERRAGKKAPKSAKRVRGHKALLGAAAACAALAAALALCLTELVVINGEVTLAINHQVTVNGVRQSLTAERPSGLAPGTGSDENHSGELARLADTNQYVCLETEREEAPARIIVSPPGETPLPAKNAEAVSFPGEEPRSLAPAQVYPVIGDLAVREGPDTAYAQIGELYSGQCVTKVGIWGDWAVLQWEGGLAYAFNAYLYDAPAEDAAYPPLTRFASEPVNVRALPTSREESEILYELQTGQAVTCTGTAGDWTQILWHGQKAYVFSKYLIDEAERGTDQ